MTRKPTVGFVGVGLMGHGLARNIALKGWPLVYLDHPGNRPTADLDAAGAARVGSLAGIAEAADTILLCVTGTPQVEAVVLGRDGLLPRLGPRHVVVDCSTAIPESTLRVAAAVAGAGARFLDAPLTRTPKEAEAGRANVLVGGDPETVAEIRPILQAFAETVTHVGPVGAGHRMKLLHNFVSLGSLALLAEAGAAARRGGVDMAVLLEVLAKGGGGGVALARMAPYLTDGDVGAVRFSLANAAKDLSYYTAMTDGLGLPSRAARGILSLFELAVAGGEGDKPVPTLVDLLDRERRREGEEP